MKAPTDLFALIKSLTTSEKRYFKVFASKHLNGVGNSVKLFNAIEAQDQYDEPEIRRRFQHERFARQLPVQKNYLYDLILRSLRSYHRERTEELRLKEALCDAEILFARGLFEQCGEVLARAREIAEREESFDLLLSVLSWQTRVAYTTADTLRLAALGEDRNAVLELQRNLAEYTRISLELLELERAGGWLRDEHTCEALTRICEHPLMRTEDAALSFKAKSLFYNSWNVSCALNDDRESAYGYARQYLDLIESNPDFLRNYPRSHVTALSNVASAAFRTGRLVEMWEAVDKLRAIRADADDLRARIVSSVYHHTLNACVATGDFERGADEVPTIVKELAGCAEMIPDSTRKALAYLMSYVEFGAGRHERALAQLQEILNESRNDTRQDIQKAARVLHLIVHYELGHVDILPYLVRSTYRMLLGREHLDTLDRAVLGLLRRLPAVSNARQLSRELRTARGALAASSGTAGEGRLKRYIDLDAWLQSKLEQRQFADVVRERLRDNGATAAAA